MVGGHRRRLHWDSSDGCRHRPHYYTRESPMQQWLNLAAALMNLTIAIVNRYNTSREQPTNETKS